jgi:phosphotransferase system IIB component
VLINEVEHFNAFLQDFALYLALSALILVILAIVWIYLSGHHRKPAVDDHSFVTALGGKENIQAATARGSRLIIKLKDDQKVDVPLLEKLGYGHYVRMTRQMTFVIGPKAGDMATAIMHS